jgi:hypothetical protein
MNARWWQIATLAVLMVHGAARDGAACSCPASGPPCQAAWDVDAIFAGTVRAIDADIERVDDSARLRETTVLFDVDQPFLNAVVGPVEIVTNELSTCGYRFSMAKKYLVYAHKGTDGRWTTSICSRTRPLAEASEDLKFLAALPSSGKGARVYGRVNEWGRHPAEPHGVDYGPLENISVNVRGATFSRHLLTDRDGRYELTGVPLGPVSISVVTPSGFRTAGERDVEVKDLRACVAADFTMHAESAAYGIVTDEHGRPLAGVRVEAVADELAGYQPKAMHNPATTNTEGRFSFDHLPPGAYVFGVRITSELNASPSSSPTFLPGTGRADEATVFQLKTGDRTDVGTIRLVQR